MGNTPSISRKLSLFFVRYLISSALLVVIAIICPFVDLKVLKLANFSHSYVPRKVSFSTKNHPPLSRSDYKVAYRLPKRQKIDVLYPGPILISFEQYRTIKEGIKRFLFSEYYFRIPWFKNSYLAFSFCHRIFFFFCLFGHPSGLLLLQTLYSHFILPLELL